MRDVFRRLFRSAAIGLKPCAIAIWVTALLLFSPSYVDAQVTTATLIGLVRDNSAAVIPGASVVATHEGTGVSREGVTDGNGEFVFSALPSGPYTVRIELTSFKTISQRGIQLGAGQTVTALYARSGRNVRDRHRHRELAPDRDGDVAAGRQPRVAGGP